MEKLLFKTDTFEGPLDLLLFLIQKHKMDICDIQISELLTQYTGYLDEMQRLDLEVASSFLEMASRLVYIKTVMLLPRHEEEGEQLKAQLQGELIEYQLCRQVAMQLGEQNRMQSLFVRPQMKLETDMPYDVAHSANLLARAYWEACGRGKRRLPPPVQAFSGIVSRRVVSVGSRIVWVLKSLYRNGRASWQSLFEASSDRSELVATFLAVLELVKSKRIAVDGDQVVFNRSGGRAVLDAAEGSEFDG